MRIKYLATFAAISLLILGITTACSSPSSTTASTSSVDPCAGKQSTTKPNSVGGALAKELQGKPVVVDVYASWCPACQNIAPTVSKLKQQYAGKANFIVLDVSDKSSTTIAEARARELGLSEFLAANKTQTGSITIIDPATGKILAQHHNNPDQATYTKVLDVAIAK
jgi:thiol-disulfide isomerase/thioredoxin